MRSSSWRAVLFSLLALVVLFSVVPVFAQAADPDAGQASSGNDMGKVISTQVVVSYLLVWLGESLKRAKSFPWVCQGAAVANRVMAGIFAAIQTVGIAYSYNSASGELVITGLTLAAATTALVEFGRSYITQKVLWVLAFKPPSAPPADPAAV